MVILFTDKSTGKKIAFDYSDLTISILSKDGRIKRRISSSDLLKLLEEDRLEEDRFPVEGSSTDTTTKVEEDKKVEDLTKQFCSYFPEFNLKIKEPVRYLLSEERKYESRKEAFNKRGYVIVDKNRNLRKFQPEALERTLRKAFNGVENNFPAKLASLGIDKDTLIRAITSLCLESLNKRFYDAGSIPSALEVQLTIERVMGLFKSLFYQNK